MTDENRERDHFVEICAECEGKGYRRPWPSPGQREICAKCEGTGKIKVKMKELYGFGVPVSESPKTNELSDVKEEIKLLNSYRDSICQSLENIWDEIEKINGKLEQSENETTEAAPKEKVYSYFVSYSLRLNIGGKRRFGNGDVQYHKIIDSIEDIREIEARLNRINKSFFTLIKNFKLLKVTDK